MTTMIILSDTHGNKADIDKLATVLSESDYIVHLGDVTTDMKEVSALYPDKTYRVVGNCDFYPMGDEQILEIEGHRIFMCHGHRYGVKSSLERLAYRAKELDCDIALYGHTHEARIEEIGGVLTVNPGCMTRYSIDKSYCYLCIHGKKVVPTIVPIR
ncbi:MAG: metallophosphoesterase [Clostridia bacterium]|nr:metallophosphoesterase [Clostridia bacterium]